jgi:hypothetical protein
MPKCSVLSLKTTIQNNIPRETNKSLIKQNMKELLAYNLTIYNNYRNPDMHFFAIEKRCKRPPIS